MITKHHALYYRSLYILVASFFLVSLSIVTLVEAQTSSLWVNRNVPLPGGDGDGHSMVWHSGAGRVIISDGKHTLALFAARHQRSKELIELMS